MKNNHRKSESAEAERADKRKTAEGRESGAIWDDSLNIFELMRVQLMHRWYLKLVALISKPLRAKQREERRKKETAQCRSKKERRISDSTLESS